MMLSRLFVGLLIALALTACQAPVRPVAPPSDDAVAPASVERVPTRAPAATKPARKKEVRLVPPPPPAETTGDDIYQRLVARFADPPCVEDRVVQRWERTYGRWAPRFASQLEAILPLMALALEEIETHHLPGEFALLPIVESWYRPDAGSARTAYGMWQFTTTTARHQGLRIVPGFDERLAPQASTRAAMRYLAMLQNRFGDWKLADMAFNAGEYRLIKALARAKPEHKRAVAALHLPPGLSMTTYEHLAKVQALACLIAEAPRFGIELPRATRIEPLEVVRLAPGFASLDAAARGAGIDPAALRRLNPAFLHGRIAPNAPREILLPRSAAQRLASATPPATEPVAMAQATPALSPVAEGRAREYRVRRGDTLSAIAQRLGLRLSDLLRWNQIQVKDLLHPGQLLRLEP